MRAKFKKNLNLFKTQSETQEGCMQGIYKGDSKRNRIFPLFLWVKTRKSQSQKEIYVLIFLIFKFKSITRILVFGQAHISLCGPTLVSYVMLFHRIS